MFKQIITSWLLLTLYVTAQTQKETDPSSLGCTYEPERIIRCQNTTLDNIVHSVRILDSAVNASLETTTIEVINSTVPHLPYVFPRFSNKLESIRLVKCQLEFVYPDAFAKLGETLRYLNLSYNKLHSIPYALAVLENLEILDLSDNQIVFLNPSPVFDGLVNLKELILDKNFLGLSSDHVTDVRQPNVSEPVSNHPHQLASDISREDFNLGVAVKTLTKLSLRGNKFLRIPDELWKISFPMLRSLDLSENLIQILPEFNVRLLPNLEVLLLNSNRIQSVAFYSLPVKLLHLDLSDNPFHCDCESLWLYEWYHHSNSTVVLPICDLPIHIKGHHLSTVGRSILCPEPEGKNSVTYVHKTTWKYRILSVETTFHSIVVSWVVERDGFDSWGLVYRRASDSPYQMILSSNHRAIKPNSNEEQGEVIFIDNIEGLEPATNYFLCVAIIQNDKFLMEPTRCHKVRTKPALDKKSPKFVTLLTAISSFQRSIAVKWKTFISNRTKRSTNDRQLFWKLSVRQFQTSNVTEIIIRELTTPGPNGSFEYSINDLLPGSGYVVCLEADIIMEGKNLTKVPSFPVVAGDKKRIICKEVVTIREEVFPVTEVAIATTVSTTTTVFVAVIMFFCCPKSLFRCQAKKWKEKLLRRKRKATTPVEKETVTCNNPEGQTKLEEEEDAQKLDQIVSLPNGRYLGPKLGSQRKITPVAIPQIPPSEPPENEVSIDYSVTSEVPNDECNETNEIETHETIEVESHETNEDEGYLTPKPKKKNKHLSRHHSYNKDGDGFGLNRGEGYIHPSGIHYLGGRKVQVFVHGSRTLPRKMLIQTSGKRTTTPFHPRYSLPHAWRRKEKEVEKPPKECFSNASLWFKSNSTEDFSSLRTKRKEQRFNSEKEENNPYCIEHV